MNIKEEVEVILLRAVYPSVIRAMGIMAEDWTPAVRVSKALEELSGARTDDFPESLRPFHVDLLAKASDPAGFSAVLEVLMIGLMSTLARFSDSVIGDVGLASLCEESAATAGKSGFVGQSLPDFVALAHSELSEALEEHRDHRRPDETWYSLKSAKMEAAAREELGLGPDDPLPRGVNVSLPVAKGTPGAKPEGIPSEIADTVIRCAHYCGANGIDLAAVVAEKAEFNKTRGFRHGNRAL